MSIQQRTGRRWPAALVSSLMMLASTTAAEAGGGFSQGVARSDAWTTVQSAYASYNSQTFADVETGAQATVPGGVKKAWANATAGNFTTFVVEDGHAQYEQDKSAKSRVYAKGGNILAKARSENHTVIYIDGHAYVVVEELAKAISRTTPSGTHGASLADTVISTESSGYLDVNTGTTTEATIRVRQ
ncbi:MAG: hypothetical protein ACLFPA_07220 [Dichotomicrobium sp.]